MSAGEHGPRPDLAIQDTATRGLDDIDDVPAAVEHAFPAPTFRDHQKQAIIDIVNAFQDGYEYVVLDGPTGSGKSYINTTVARLARTAYYTTPQNRLIDQIAQDDCLADIYTAIKGRTHYDCTSPNCELADEHTADECPSNNPDYNLYDYDPKRHGPCCNYAAYTQYLDGNDQYGGPVCQYPEQLRKALTADCTLTNFHYFIVSPHLDTRELTVIDESHNLESAGFDFCDIKLTNYTIPFYDQIADDLPTTPDALHSYILTDLQAEISMRMRDPDWKAESNQQVIERLERLQQKISKITELGTQFVVEDLSDANGTADGVALKPLYVDDFFQEYVFPKATSFLLSSATFLTPKQQLQEVGVDPANVAVVSLPNQFPVENRPIKTPFVADMRTKHAPDDAYQQLADRLLDIVHAHRDASGIVHCVSYNRQHQLAQALRATPIADRVLVHDAEESEETLQTFKESSRPQLLLSVAMEEGIDLKDDHARYNVIVKLPNPSMGDNRIHERTVEYEEWDWYFRQTAINLVQAYGRTTRTAEDTSTTYILDASFEQFYKKNGDLLPGWFTEALDADVGASQSTLTKVTQK